MDKKLKNRILPLPRLGSMNILDLLLLLYDLAAVTVSYFFALWFRFDCQFTEIPEAYLMTWLKFAPIYGLIAIVVFSLFHLYQSIWKFASFVELRRILWARDRKSVV